MKLKCPACGAPIPAAAINVQQMIAVCPECDNVFKFEGTFRQQRRKLKAPAQFQVADDDPDRLDMAFHWSWRTEPPFSMITIVVAFVFVLATFVGMVAENAGGAAILPLLPAAYLGYTLLTLLVNSTHYESDGETLAVYTKPLPYFRYGSKSIPMDEIERVSVERVTDPRLPQGKDGFFDVFVHTLDGDLQKIAAIVNYQHAYFIAQEIEAFIGALRETSAQSLDRALIETDDADAPDQLDELPEAPPYKALRS